jgi:hypothetical protein
VSDHLKDDLLVESCEMNTRAMGMFFESGTLWTGSGVLLIRIRQFCVIGRRGSRSSLEEW